MTEPTLPPKVEVPSFAATPDGYAGAYRRSRAIRLRRALTAGGTGTTLALVLVAALALPARHGDRDQLVTTSPTPAPSTAAPSASPAGPDASPLPQAPSPGGTSSPGTRAPADGPTPGATAGATSAPGPGPLPQDEVGPPKEEVGYDATRTCDGAGPTPATGWCAYYDGDTTGRTGTTVTVATTICRLPGQGTGTLTFGSGQQAEFHTGAKDGSWKWTWSDGHHFAPASPPVTVAAGRCVRWYVAWALRDAHGTPLPPGDYYVDARPLEIETGAYVKTDNPVAFTVTS